MIKIGSSSLWLACKIALGHKIKAGTCSYGRLARLPDNKLQVSSVGVHVPADIHAATPAADLISQDLV
jgi:hypothetical protein